MADDAGPKGSPAYMTTYGDMMTLLLCFFVLLFAMSKLDISKFETAAISLSGAFSVLPKHSSIFDLPVPGQPKKINEQLEDMQQKKQAKRREEISRLQSMIRERKLDEIIRIREDREEGGLHITIGEMSIFKSGSAEIIPEITGVLDQVIEIIETENDIVDVWGHTDAQPISTYRYRNNWELSAARAQSVIQYIMSRSPEYDPGKLRAVAAGSEHPVASNDTPEGRAKNRRVELFIKYKD